MKDFVRPLAIGDCIAALPLIQGGMGVGISLGNLAGSVAKEGGVGIISSAQIGFMEPDFDKAPLAANLRAMETEYKKARKLAPEGVIGFNIMTALKHYETYVKRAAEIGADLIISGAGLPTELPELVKGSRTKIAPIVSTKKSASVILKYWDRKYRRQPDLIVIEGPEAGGHLGFKKEELDIFDEAAYEEEIRGILSVVSEYEKKYETKIPTALAGGISDGRKAERAFRLGADAIQTASRFVTTVECDASDAYKEAYLKAKKEDIVIVKSPVGMPGRAVRNRFIEEVEAGKRKPATICRQCLRSCNPQEIPYCITTALVNAAKGDVDHALIFCGADAYKQNKIETVKEVINSLLS